MLSELCSPNSTSREVGDAQEVVRGHSLTPTDPRDISDHMAHKLREGEGWKDAQSDGDCLPK